MSRGMRHVRKCETGKNEHVHEEEEQYLTPQSDKTG